MTTHTPNTSAALAVITELAQQGHALSYIAKALTLRGFVTPRGCKHWHEKQVARIAAAHGVAVGYRRIA